MGFAGFHSGLSVSSVDVVCFPPLLSISTLPKLPQPPNISRDPMGEGRQGGGAVMLSKLMLPQNPIEQLQCRFKELELGFKTWLSQQSLPVEAAVVTATSSLQGAAIGGLMGTFSQEAASLASPRPQANINPQAMASLKQAQALSGGPLVQARNFAVMTGVNAGISCVMKRLRGKEDVESSKPFHPITIYTLMVSMVAAFGSGAVFSLVSGVGGSNQFTNALTSGLFFALVQGGIFKKYEKKFKKGLLTDKTLPLLNDSALRDVSIPPGPRLVILDHIHRALSMAID